jgi:hypothetical protein
MSYKKTAKANVNYAKRLKSPGMHSFKINGKNVKGIISADGRSLQILQARQLTKIMPKLKTINRRSPPSSSP